MKTNRHAKANSKLRKRNRARTRRKLEIAHQEIANLKNELERAKADLSGTFYLRGFVKELEDNVRQIVADEIGVALSEITSFTKEP